MDNITINIVEEAMEYMKIDDLGLDSLLIENSKAKPFFSTKFENKDSNEISMVNIFNPVR